MMRLSALIFFWVSLLTATSQAQLRPVYIEYPRYPEIARMAQIEGKVEARITIAADGTVPMVETHSGDAILRKEVEGNIRRWRFAPPTESQELTQTIEFIFELEEPRREHACARVSFSLPARVRIVSNPPTIDTYKTPAKSR